MAEKVDALSFSVGDFEFRTAFVVKDEASFETLQKLAEKNNIEIHLLGETSFKGIVSVVSKCNSSEDANSFFTYIKNHAEQWKTELTEINGYRTLIFFVGELNNESTRRS